MYFFEVFDNVGEMVSIIDWVWRRVFFVDSVSSYSNCVIFFIESWSLVNDISIVISCDICVVQNFEFNIFERFVEVVEERFVFLFQYFVVFDFVSDGEFGFFGIFVECVQKFFKENVCFVGFFIGDFDVFEIWVNSKIKM